MVSDLTLFHGWISLLTMCAVNELTYCLERMMDSDYVSVRPVLAQPSPQHQADNMPPSSDPIQAQVSVCKRSVYARATAAYLVLPLFLYVCIVMACASNSLCIPHQSRKSSRKEVHLVDVFNYACPACDVCSHGSCLSCYQTHSKVYCVLSRFLHALYGGSESK